MTLNSFPLGVFDLVLLAVLVIGILRGRKHGMSEELLQVCEWVCAVVVSSLLYEKIGGEIERTSPFGLLTSYIVAYLSCIVVVLTAFVLVKRAVGGKLAGSDLFGKSEYYLGMLSGMIRFGCILVVGLALLNARYFSSQEVQALERYQNDLYGSTFFPGLHSLQATVFERSLSGTWIKNHMGLLLIKPTVPAGKALHQQEYVLPN